MDRRGTLFCLCWFTGITAIGFLIALLISYKTLHGECEHPEDICYNNGQCYFSYEGFICLCPKGFYGRRCQYRSSLSMLKTHKKPGVQDGNIISFNETSVVNQTYTVLNPDNSKNSDKTDKNKEVHVQENVRDQTFGTKYWKFIIVFGTSSSLLFILSFVVYTVVNRVEYRNKKKSQDYYGIKYEQASQGQIQHLISNASSLDVKT